MHNHSVSLLSYEQWHEVKSSDVAFDGNTKTIGWVKI